MSEKPEPGDAAGRAGRPGGEAPRGGDVGDEAPHGSDAAGEADHPDLEALRARILELDDALVRLVGERRDLVLEVGRVKERLGLPVMDPGREARVVRRAAELAREEGVDEELVRDVIWRIVASARQAQEGRSSWGPPEHPAPNDERGPAV